MKKEYWLAAYTICCWGTLPAVTKLTLKNVPNMQVLFVSSVIAAICLYLYLIFSGRIKAFCLLSVVDLGQLIGLGFFGNFLYSAFYYESLRMLPSADACTINYLWPAISAFCAAIILREKINVREWLAILLSFAGMAIISTKGSGLAMKNAKGVLLCAAGAVCYGIFNVLNKKKGLDQLLCTAVYFTVTAVSSAITVGNMVPMSRATWAGMLWLGIFIDALAILTWGTALQISEVGILSNLAYLTPIVTMLVSYAVLGEPIQRYAVMGMLFVLSGCMLQVFSRWSLTHEQN